MHGPGCEFIADRSGMPCAGWPWATGKESEMIEFKPLKLSTLAPRTGYARPYFSAPNLVRMDSSALEVMTDLRYVAAETVRADVALELAAQRMIVRGVRSLLVVDALEDVTGIITSRDLLGERAAAGAEAPGADCDGVTVGEAMTPADSVEVLPLDDVLHAHVGDVVATLKHSGRQHALVVEVNPLTGKPVIRGVFSASQIARQLGIAPNTEDVRLTFSQIDRAMQR